MRLGEKNHEVIVKRRSKKKSHEEHGGAWKVAFADFTLAMMALFMVLWIIQPQIEEQAETEELGDFLLEGGVGIFDGKSRTPVDLNGVPTRDRRQKPQTEASELKRLVILMESLALQLEAEANMEVQVVPQGLRILIKDDQQRDMFERGSAKLHADFEVLLSRLAGVLAKVDNKLIISGHTDSTRYRRTTEYNNWNLSGDRALLARNVMVAGGLPPKSVLQVTAQADGMPIRPEAPTDGINRRIELLVLTTEAEGLYRELFGDGQALARYSAKTTDFVAPESKSGVGGGKSEVGPTSIE